ncbi:hypothetical protein HDU98_010765 [Podochytrium sp. JEL0797]|nr:hypothetical protein HDU98_010765 [Podochytrium sp. JEL0797]
MYPNVLTSPDYATFTKAVEAAHNVVHYYIGGTQGDLYFIDLSTNDPLFFVHHANVDRYWHLWQYHHSSIKGQYTGTINLPPGSNTQVTLQSTDLMVGWNLPVQTALFSDQGNGYCTKYLPYSQSTMSISVSDERPPKPPRSETRKRQHERSLVQVGDVPPIPDTWEMTSSVATGYEFESNDVMSNMHDSMFKRIREGEMELARLKAAFHLDMSNFLQLDANLTRMGANFMVLSKYKANAANVASLLK